MATTTFGEQDVLAKFSCDSLIPDKIAPNDMVALDIGETHILTFVLEHVFVDERTFARLVDMFAVEISDTFLDQLLGLGNFLLGRGVAAILVIDSEIDIPILMEEPAMIIASLNFLTRPFLDRGYILLSEGGVQRK